MTAATADIGRDIHSPANVKPENYRYFTAFYQGNSDDMQLAYGPENGIFYPAYEREGGYGGNFDTKGTCDHCGTRFAHGVAYRHVPTGTLIMVGHQCASETFDHADRAALVRTRAERAAERIKVARLAREALEPETVAAIDYLCADGGKVLNGMASGYAGFLLDLISKAARYPLSDKQQAALVKAHRSQLERKVEQADEPKVDAPEGRVEFAGHVISVKWYDGDFGNYQGMTIKIVTDDGFWLTWVRVPARLTDRVKPGDSISLRATLTRGDDSYFAIGKRPFVVNHTQGEDN
jgi:hypothetical protein